MPENNIILYVIYASKPKKEKMVATDKLNQIYFINFLKKIFKCPLGKIRGRKTRVKILVSLWLVPLPTSPLSPLVFYEELKCKYSIGSQISTRDSSLLKALQEHYKPSSLGIKRWKKLYSWGGEASELGLKTSRVF